MKNLKRFLIFGLLLLLVTGVGLWVFRIPLLQTGLRGVGIIDPKVSSLQFIWPNSLALKKASGITEGIRFSLRNGQVILDGFAVMGKDLHLMLDGLDVILPGKFSTTDEKTTEEEISPEPVTKEFSLADIPQLSIQLKKATVSPGEGLEPWIHLSGDVTGGLPRELFVEAETIAGSFKLNGSIETTRAEARLHWESAKNPDWSVVLPKLRDWGLEIPSAFDASWNNVEATLSTTLQGTAASWNVEAGSDSLGYNGPDLSVTAKGFQAKLNGELLADWLSANGEWSSGPTTLRKEKDLFTIETLSGTIEMNPTSNKAGINVGNADATVSKIQIKEISGTLDLLQKGEGPVTAKLLATAQAFKGSIEIDLEARVVPFEFIKATINLADVSLGSINERFQFFDGVVEASVKGNVQFEWENGRLTILPSVLEMVPGTEGKLRYEKAGWMTGKPELDVVALSEKLRIDKLLRREDSAGILVELAARNLTVTKLRIALFQKEMTDREGQIELEGFSLLEKTKIPVVLTVPLRGDLQETIRVLTNAALLLE